MGMVSRPAFQKIKRLRPSRANFIDAFRCNDVLKRRTKKWGGKFIITMEKKKRTTVRWEQRRPRLEDRF